MKVLILNSGLGQRMGALTKEHPKCMTEIEDGETILSRQLKIIEATGLSEVIMTTGYFEGILKEYCHSLRLRLKYTFVHNPLYRDTNYIYSIYLAKELLNDDLILMHGDLVFEEGILHDFIKQGKSCMTVSSTLPLPPKDFKAVISDGRIIKIGVDFFDNAVVAQPLYRMNRFEWLVWLAEITRYCETGRISCYAEEAFNDVSERCPIFPLDVFDRLCAEIDTNDDLVDILKKIERGKFIETRGEKNG